MPDLFPPEGPLPLRQYAENLQNRPGRQISCTDEVIWRESCLPNPEYQLPSGEPVNPDPHPRKQDTQPCQYH